MKKNNSRNLFGNYKLNLSPSESISTKNHISGRLKGKNAIQAVFVALCMIIGMCLMTGCKTCHTTVIHEQTITRYTDTTIFHTDTTYYEVPVEIYNSFTSLLDTLKLETNYSTAWTCIDTTNKLLIGELKNKKVQIPIEYVWKDRIIRNDSIITVEKPVYIDVVKTKVPSWSWWTLGICILMLILLGLRIYMKFALGR